MLFLNSDLPEYYPKQKKTPPLMKKNNLLISKYKLDCKTSQINQQNQKTSQKTSQIKLPSIINLRKDVPKSTKNNKILMIINTNWISKLEKFVFLFNKKLNYNKNSWLINRNMNGNMNGIMNDKEGKSLRFNNESKESKEGKEGKERNENIFITRLFGNETETGIRPGNELKSKLTHSKIDISKSLSYYQNNKNNQNNKNKKRETNKKPFSMKEIIMIRKGKL